MKKMLPALLLPIALASCQGGDLPPVTPTPVTTLSGSVQGAGGWLQLRASDDQAIGERVTPSASGSFQVDLPSPAETRLGSLTGALSALGCSGTVTSSDPAARGLGVSAADSAAGRLLPVSVARTTFSRTVTMHALVYSDRATSISGQLDCASLVGGALPRVPVNVKAELLPGWNTLRAEVKASLGLSGISASGSVANEAPSTGSWITQAELQRQVGF